MKCWLFVIVDVWPLFLLVSGLFVALWIVASIADAFWPREHSADQLPTLVQIQKKKSGRA